MHAWTALQNPQGSFAADNWALPYLRARRAVPNHADAAAGRALSLTVGGDVFVRNLLTDANLRTSSNATPIDSAIDAARSRAAANSDDAALVATWRALCDALSRIVGPQVVALLEPNHPGHG
jgi:hypothetical protein